MRYIFLLAFLSIAGFSFSQNIQAPHDNNASLTIPLQKIYFTTDKEIYTPSEQLWFSAYLFENNSLLRDTANVLTIGLYDVLSEKMVVIKKFLIENRIATGNMLLPDSLFSGDYTLVAYTNLVDETNTPIAANFKPLKIYDRTGDKPFTTTLRMADSLSSGDRIAVLHEMLPKSLAATAKDVKAFYRFGTEKPRKLPLENYGTGVVYINTKDINQLNHILIVTTIYNEDTVRARIELPMPNEKADKYTAVFNPEGGTLVADYKNNVFVELLKNNVVGSFKGVLLENNQPIDTIYTKANEANFFAFKPKANHQYTVSVNFGDSIIQYNLPEVVASGVKLTLPAIVVNDTLSFELATKEKQLLKLVIVDLNGMPFAYSFTLNGTEKMTISLDGFARGLCNLLILDDNTNKLLANTYFFAHYADSAKVILQTSKDTYKTRDSIDLNLYVLGTGDTLQSAIATISCTLLSRVDLVRQKRIETDFILNGLAYNEQTLFQQRSILKHKPLLENIIRLKSLPVHIETVIDYNNMKQATLSKPHVILNLAKDGAYVKSKADWILICDTKFSMHQTNKKGTLELNTEDLILPDGRKLFLRERGERNGGYSFVTEDALAKAYQNIKIPVYKPVYREQAMDVAHLLVTDKTEKFSKTLDKVVIKAKKDVGFEKIYRTYGAANPCGDYVCEYNVLNCSNHIVPYTWPVKGARYRSNASRELIIYEGCEDKEGYQPNIYLPPSTPVYLSRTFLGMDSALLKQAFPEYLSTICWMPFTRIFKRQDNQIVFNSSDQKGAYLISVQGFTEKGQPFFAQKIIKVND